MPGRFGMSDLPDVVIGLWGDYGTVYLFVCPRILWLRLRNAVRCEVLVIRLIHSAARPGDRPSWRGGRECSKQAARQAREGWRRQRTSVDQLP